MPTKPNKKTTITSVDSGHLFKKRIVTTILYIVLVLWILLFGKGNLVARFTLADPAAQAGLFYEFIIPTIILGIILGYLQVKDLSLAKLKVSKPIATLGVSVVIIAVSLWLFLLLDKTFSLSYL